MTLPSSSDEGSIATAPLSREGTAPPACVGRFVLLHTLGSGSAGVVVAAHDPVLDRRIALKVLRAGQTPASDARLLREAQAMARLAHPNVVTVHEAGVAEGCVYVAMELVEGGTLRSWLTAPRTWREIRDRFVEAGRGLAAAHEAGLVHRDFKPENVLVGSDGRARVTDFGLVRTLRVTDDPEESACPVGTPRYMAPEQHRGECADPRADQFAFCVALYEALWRADPFAAPDPAARRARVLRGDMAAPPEHAPLWLAAAVLRGLAPEPAQRFPSMRALLERLTRDRELERRRRLSVIAVALVGAAAATAITVAMMSRHDRTAIDSNAPDPRRFQLGIGVAWAPQWGSAERSSWQALDRANLDQVVAAGGTATNLTFDWSLIEPAPGAHDWSYPDQQVAEVETHGLEPFAYAGGTPAWVGRDENARCPEPYRNPPPRDRAGIAAFREFFRTLSRRYCGRVKYYAFWNEPNGCSWMSCGCGDQTPEQRQLYARWLSEWYQAMRDGCGDVVLAIGGLDCRWGGDPDRPSTACGEFLDELYADGAGDAFDAVALHPLGYGGDLELALRANKTLNREAIRRVSDSLQRHGDATRRLWIEWGFATADDSLKAKLIAAGLTELRALTNVFHARYRTVVDPPGQPPYGLASRAEASARQPRAPWLAFRDRALGPRTVWHGPINPGLEYQGPAAQQFAAPMPSWGPNGGWAFHDRFPRPGNAVLGRKLGFYSAGEPEQVRQILVDRFESGRRYCFWSAAQGGRDDTGVLPYEIGYLEGARVVVLRRQTVVVDARWRETTGVCHVASGPEVGRPIVIGLGSRDAGGSGDVWFDNLRVTSAPQQDQSPDR